MLETLAINNQEYTQQSIDIFLDITSKFLNDDKCKGIVTILKKPRKQEKLVNEIFKSISNILKSNKHQLLDLSNAWLCGLKLIDNDSTIDIYANLHNAKLRYSEFKNVDFSYANLNNADFRNSTLTNVDFSDKGNNNSNNRLTGIKFFDIKQIKIPNGTKIKTRWIDHNSSSNCMQKRMQTDFGCPPTEESYKEIQYADVKEGQNQTIFKGNIDFTNIKKYNIDFGCDLYKGKLEIKNLKQLCNQEDKK